MSLRSLHITKADSVVLLGMLCCVKVLTRSLRQPKGIIKDRRWRQKNGKQIPLFGVISSHWISFSHFLFALFSHSSPNALWVCGTLSKAYVSEAAQNKSPVMSSSYPHCLLIILQSFLYLCKLGRKGRLNNPVIYNTVAAQKSQCKMCSRRFGNNPA